MYELPDGFRLFSPRNMKAETVDLSGPRGHLRKTPPQFMGDCFRARTEQRNVGFRTFTWKLRPYSGLDDLRGPWILVLVSKMCSGSEAGSFLRLVDSFITQRKARGLSRTCNKSKEKAEEDHAGAQGPSRTCEESREEEESCLDGVVDQNCGFGLGRWQSCSSDEILNPQNPKP